MDNIYGNMSEPELLNFMKNGCRCCLSMSQSHVNLLTKQNLGLTLMEMVNSLTGLRLDELDGSKSLMVCLNCAGKVVNFHEFRELCQNTERKFKQMEMALRAKRHSSQFELDDDIQIFYVCKVCKISFEDSQHQEYLEHKQQHIMKGELKAHSTPIVVKEEGEKKKGGRKRRSLVDAPSTSGASKNLYECRQCPQTFPTYMSRNRHEIQEHVAADKIDKNETFPTTNKSLKRLHRARRSPVANHTSKESSIGKIYNCERCNSTFPNHKGLYWHRLKAHGMLMKFSSASNKVNKVPKSKSPKETEKTFSCRHCEKVFDKRYSKYNHERICPCKNDPPQTNETQNSQSNNDCAVIEEPITETPVVDLIEDDDPQSNNDDTANTETNVICSRCPMEFTSGRARSLHEKNIHNLQVNECRICGKVFSKYANRYQHEKRCQLNHSTSMTSEKNGDAVVPTNGEQTGFQAAFTQSL